MQLNADLNIQKSSKAVDKRSNRVVIPAFLTDFLLAKKLRKTQTNKVNDADDPGNPETTISQFISSLTDSFTHTFFLSLSQLSFLQV